MASVGIMTLSLFLSCYVNKVNFLSNLKTLFVLLCNRYEMVKRWEAARRAFIF